MSRSALFKFRLNVAGDAPNSAQARANLDVLCRAHVAGRHENIVVDVFREPKRALADAVFMTPTLVRFAPLAVQRIVGTLNPTQPVPQAFELQAVLP